MARSKYSSQKAHARRRWMERVGDRLNKADYRRIANQIRFNKNVTFFKRQSNNITLWKIDIKHNNFIAVYDKKRKSVITIMPFDFFSDDRGLADFWRRK